VAPSATTTSPIGRSGGAADATATQGARRAEEEAVFREQPIPPAQSRRPSRLGGQGNGDDLLALAGEDGLAGEESGRGGNRWGFSWMSRAEGPLGPVAVANRMFSESMEQRMSYPLARNK
jgi:hypothetical protein